MIEFKYLSAFLFGLMSSGHCFGMCGGISAAFGISTSSQPPIQRLSRLFAYNSGRIVCYTAVGLVLGFFGEVFVNQFTSWMLPLRIIAGLMLMAMACYVGQWWRGITVLERVGQRIWKYIQPLSLKLKPSQSFSATFAFGALWGLLPCGLVYSMLVWVTASGDGVSAALLMLCFGLGTWPAMVAMGYGSARLKIFLQANAVRHGSAIVLFLYGLWTILSVMEHSHGY